MGTRPTIIRLSPNHSVASDQIKGVSRHSLGLDVLFPVRQKVAHYIVVDCPERQPFEFEFQDISERDAEYERILAAWKSANVLGVDRHGLGRNSCRRRRRRGF